jgi:hypothetical protein
MFSMSSGSIVLAFSLGAVSDHDFDGIVESRPAGGHVGEWVIGGRSFTAKADTEIETDDGPLDLGACASVDREGRRIEEIESARAEKCTQTNRN